MKKIKNILLYCTSLMLVGCQDFIDNAPDDTLTRDKVFADKTRMEDWLSGVYNKIPDPYWAFYTDYGYDILGDDLDVSQRYEQFWGDGAIKYRTGQWYTNSRWKANLWKDCPVRIRSAYQFIKYAHSIPDQGVSESDVEMMKNECRFLIAYYYWLMTEAYGSVPFFDGLVDVTDENLMRGQEPFDSMVDWIDEQLVDLSKKLPDTWIRKSSQYYGRATSIMCLAVRARMLLFAASPLVNGNEWYKGFKNHDGRERFSQSYDANKWKRAADACKELITAAHAAGHDLVREYNADGSIDPFMSCNNTLFLRGDLNKEALFVRANCNFRHYEKHSTPRAANGNGGLGVTQNLVDAFFMKNGTVPITGYNGNYGKPIINNESGYSEKGFSTKKDIRKTKYNLYRGCPNATVDSIGADGNTYNQVAAEGTYNMYVDREPRFYLAVLWNRIWYYQADRETKFMSGEIDGGPTHDAPQGGYLNRKKVSLEMHSRNNIHPYRPGILYRLGEAYLNYVEALNECDPGNPDILKYLNLIRERAGVPQYGTGTDSNGFKKIPVNGQDEVRQVIYRERRVELCCEDGIRYFDLRRWKKAEEVLAQPFYGMNFFGTKLSDDENDPDAYFKRTQYLVRKYERKYYWWPVHQTEIDKDPTIVQAPFWNNE